MVRVVVVVVFVVVVVVVVGGGGGGGKKIFVRPLDDLVAQSGTNNLDRS